jgi:opacity protein-like surface antigen
MIGLASDAFAQFGPPTAHESYQPGVRTSMAWEGVYFGGQIGQTYKSVDLGNSSQSLLAFILRQSILEQHVPNWTTLPSGSTTGTNYGGFIGYNWRWEEAIVGLEFNYSGTTLGAVSAADALTRIITDNSGAPDGHTYTYNVTAATSASAKLVDYATFRARGAWDAGRFLPYGFVGVAVGRVDLARVASVSGTFTDTETQTTTVTNPFTGVTTTTSTTSSTTSNLILPGPQSESQTGAFAYGYAAGLGVDFAVLPNVFLRGEWEFVQFAPVKDIPIRLHTFRTGLGVRF